MYLMYNVYGIIVSPANILAYLTLKFLYTNQTICKNTEVNINSREVCKLYETWLFDKNQ